MKLPISRRLLSCCDYVNQNDRVADVGCDHGYLSIYLLTQGIARSAIASDVNEQPLLSAVRNAEKFGVRDRMEFYLSDGLRNIPRDFNCIVCAGMGADTMISILEAAPWLKSAQYRLILQCQSRRPELRRLWWCVRKAAGWKPVLLLHRFRFLSAGWMAAQSGRIPWRPGWSRCLPAHAWWQCMMAPAL